MVTGGFDFTDVVAGALGFGAVVVGLAFVADGFDFADAVAPDRRVPAVGHVDAGAQVDVLARSAHLRYREALGEDIGEIPEGLYPGDYLIPVAEALAAEFGDRYAAVAEEAWLETFRRRAVEAMLDLIRHDLALLGIHHDLFASEAELQKEGAVDAAMEMLRSKGLVYEGTLERPKSLDPNDEWEPVELTLFKSTEFGDDQDRPMKKSDGSWTYFGSDAAYHLRKADTADLIDPAKDADIVAVQNHLEEFLGLPVRIAADTDPRSGAVTIRYRTLDQLDLICQRLTGGGI